MSSWIAMVVVGAHYLPFIALYGMWQNGFLAAGLIFGGVAVALWLPGTFSLGGWLTAGMLLVFALAVAAGRIRREPAD